MSKIRVRTDDQLDWVIAREQPDGEHNPEDLGEGELSTSFRVREMGSDTSPQLIELRYEADAEIQLHAHDEDEIIYVREGEIRLGARSYGPGTSLFVAGGTLYGFRAGPAGLQILNFRPRCDLTFITRQQLLSRKAEAKSAKG